MSASQPEIRPLRGGAPPAIWRRRLRGVAGLLLLIASLPGAAAMAGTVDGGHGRIAASVVQLPADPSPLWSCLPALSREPVVLEGPLLRPAAADADPGNAAAPQALPPDYRQRLATTDLGRPRLDRWCVWIEPPDGGGSADVWQSRWLSALQRALSQWQASLPIQLVKDPAAAQVRVWRRRPPLAVGPDGRRRASHGRATLTLERVRRGDVARLEPSVDVLLSPAQRELAIEATALHELGHAFGLWGHSDDPHDAMAAVPGAQPVLTLSRRDRATIMWLYRQPTAFGQPLLP